MLTIQSQNNKKRAMDGRVLSILLAALIAAVYFSGLGAHGLIEPDEGRYAEIPREMLESGDFVTPRLNYVRYFEKPPLLYWMNAGAMLLFGENEFAARFPSALCALLCAAAAAVTGAALFGRAAGVLSGAVCATSLLHFAVGRLAITDMPLTLFITVAIGAALDACRSDGRRYCCSVAAFWAFCALAVLAKGLVGLVLPGCVALVCSLAACRRNFTPKRLLAHVPGIALFLAICAPWFYLVCRENPDFFRFFFIQEHFLRYTTTMHDRYEPFWYFIPVIPAALVPWTGFFRARGPLREPANLFPLIWFGVIFLFFSFSGSKLIPYVAPCVPPLAILIGANLARSWGGEALARRELALSSALGLALGGGLIWYSFFGGKLPEWASPLPGLLMGAALAAGPVGAALLSRAGKRRGAVIWLCAAALAFYSQTGTIYEIMGETRSMKRVCEALAEDGAISGVTLASYNEVLQGVSFYAKRRVLIAGNAGELEFGSRDPGAEEWFLPPDLFWEEWRSGRPFALIARSSGLERIIPAGAEIGRIVSAGKYSIIFSRADGD